MNPAVLSLRKIISILLVMFFIALSMELALRFVGYLYKSYKEFKYNRYLNFGHKEITILCFGESSTLGILVDKRDSYPKQLEKKLRGFYNNNYISVRIPFHIGDNTSRMADKLKEYIEKYKPTLIILMTGINNNFSLVGSHVGKFLKNNDKAEFRVKMIITLSNFRLFNVIHYLYLKFIAKDWSNYTKKYKNFIFGEPEFGRWPPSELTWSFADSHQEAFVKLWRYDLSNMIHEAKKYNLRVLLMTYHFNGYLSSEEFISLANKEEIPLVRNDESFNLLIKNKTIKNYLLKDNWHPNKDGYAIIANNAFECIRNLDLLNLKK